MSSSGTIARTLGDDELIARAFAQLPMLGAAARWRIAPLAGGIANRSWLLEAPDTRLVLRVPVKPTADLGVDRVSEHAILVAVSTAGLAPPIVHFDSTTGVMVSEYLAGRGWTLADAHDERSMARLAERIRRLHAIEPPAAARHLDYGDLIAGYRRTLDSRGSVARSPSLPFDAEADRRLSLLRKHPRPTLLCHNDLHHRNIVDGATLSLVDWEYAAAGDGLYDLASFACYHDLSAVERAFLLEAYDSSHLRQLGAALEDHCWLFDYMHLLWLQITDTDPAERERLTVRLQVNNR